MQKRGQVTIFLVVGIIILAAFAGIFYFTSSLRQEGLLVSEETATDALGVKPRITSFVESCIREVATPGIYLLGIQGGIIHLDDPTKSLITENGIINYGYLNGENLLSTEKMEAQLNAYLEEELSLCLEDFSSFSPEITVEIEEELTAKSKIKEKEVIVTLDYPIKAIKGGETVKIDTFSESIPLKFGRAISGAAAIIKEHQKNPSQLKMQQNLGADYFVTTFPYDSSITLYSLSDSSSIIDSAPFTFMFAIKDENYNTPPELAFIQDFTLQKGAPFTYQLQASDADEDRLQFYSDSAQFPVDENGLINATASSPGTFMITFLVEDAKGEKDEQQVRMVVMENEK